MINTWGELWTVIKQWWITPLKWERKVKEEVKKEVRSGEDLIHSMFDKDIIEKQRKRYLEAMAEHDRQQQRYRDWANKVRQTIPFCQKCKDVGCEECSQWPMNQ